jgi:hypothetical protein
MERPFLDELYISYLFPPSNEATGITVFKRIVKNNAVVDVLQGKFDFSNEFGRYVEHYINNRFCISVDEKHDSISFISEFVKKGMGQINSDYKKIYSRSWLMANHFLACEYKFAHPEVFWTAEFSDPLIYDIDNNPKNYDKMIIDDEDYISKLNGQIGKLNGDFPLIENGSSAYFIAEYLVYLFSDRIIFTNENQRRIMLKQFPIDVCSLVLDKSEIKMHPTLDEEFYNIKDADLNLDEDCINIAYFGNSYYSKRNFEGLFYAVEALNHEFKDKIRIYLFVSNDKLLKRLVPSDRFIVKKPIPYLEFLNATTKFDVLVVNDLLTSGVYEVNPYLPSKLSDYMGSGNDVWALYEKGSTLSTMDLKYKSDITDYDDCLRQLVRILDDKGYGDEDCSIDNGYMAGRLTSLNELYEAEFRKSSRLRRKVKKLKKKNEKRESSTASKIRKRFRNFKRG